MIENYLLEQFVAVARYGTLLKASEELHISQPSLSRSMKKLGRNSAWHCFIGKTARSL